MDNQLILQLLQKLHHLSCANKTIHLCWIPSNIGIRGNEAADMAAKESLDQDITVSQVPTAFVKIGVLPLFFMELWVILCNFWPILKKSSSIKPLTRNHSYLVLRVPRGSSF